MPLFVVHQVRDAIQHYRAIVEAESAEQARLKAENDDIVGEWIDEGSTQFDNREMPLEDVEPLSDENDPRQKKSKPMNEFQAAVAKMYGGGDYAHLATTDDWRAAIKDCDTLFKFLMIELSTEEGCNDKEIAMQRMICAFDDVAAAGYAVLGA